MSGILDFAIEMERAVKSFIELYKSCKVTVKYDADYGTVDLIEILERLMAEDNVTAAYTIVTMYLTIDNYRSPL